MFIGLTEDIISVLHSNPPFPMEPGMHWGQEADWYMNNMVYLWLFLLLRQPMLCFLDQTCLPDSLHRWASLPGSSSVPHACLNFWWARPHIMNPEAHNWVAGRELSLYFSPCLPHVSSPCLWGRATKGENTVNVVIYLFTEITKFEKSFLWKNALKALTWKNIYHFTYLPLASFETFKK